VSFDIGNYNDVQARLVEFREKHPDGSLQPADPDHPYRVETIGEQSFIVVVAAAYRTADDTKPGIGMAWERFPGKTPYTRDSELQNAETSAWGRAIVAALAADTRKGIASANEVRNRRADQDAQRADPKAILREEIYAAVQPNPDLNSWSDVAADYASWSMGEALADATVEQLTKYRDHLRGAVAA
jgi:hypothetical protein